MQRRCGFADIRSANLHPICKLKKKKTKKNDQLKTNTTFFNSKSKKLQKKSTKYLHLKFTSDSRVSYGCADQMQSNPFGTAFARP